MKLKNTLGVVIGSMVAATSVNALAQGGALSKWKRSASTTSPTARVTSRTASSTALALVTSTDDVSLGLSYGEYHDITSEDRVQDGSHKKIKGSLTSLDAAYHFGNPGVGLRPSSPLVLLTRASVRPTVAAAIAAHFANVGTGLKYYFTENFAKASVDGMYNIDADEGEWMAGVGVGLNFGGGARQVAAVEPTQSRLLLRSSTTSRSQLRRVVRVELDVKFDFDKSRVREESYSDIKNLADFCSSTRRPPPWLKVTPTPLVPTSTTSVCPSVAPKLCATFWSTSAVSG